MEKQNSHSRKDHGVVKEIFVGSSTESLDGGREVASWLEEYGHKPKLWNDPRLFLPGENTYGKLIKIASEVDAAVFVFGEDDKVWYRHDALSQARDNVLIEYGLFSGLCGPGMVIVCRVGQPKMPSDLGGITHVDLNFPHRARRSIDAWAQSIDFLSPPDSLGG
jgi:predicted nucleotide-binding protein